MITILKYQKRKTEVMAFQANFHIKTKIVDKVLEVVSHFNYLGCDMLFKYDKDINNNMHEFRSVCVKNILKPK